MLPVVSNAISMSALFGFSGTANETSRSCTTTAFVPPAAVPPVAPVPLAGGALGGLDDGGGLLPPAVLATIRSFTVRIGPATPVLTRPCTRRRCSPAASRIRYGVRQFFHPRVSRA